MAPARTGRDNNKRIAVIKTDQTKRGIISKVIEGVRIFIIVEIKFTAPKIEEIPAICKEKIVKSTAGPLCAKYLDRGGYTVHPVPAPCSVIVLVVIKKKMGGVFKILNYLFEGRLYRELQLLTGLINFRILQLKLV